MRFHSKILAVAAVLLGLTPRDAAAQQQTFYLDRLQVPGAPDDGMVLFRPVTQPDNIFFGQLGLGFQYAPLRTNTIIQDNALLKGQPANVIDTQLTIYGSAGFELFNRLIASVNFPWNPLQTGQNPNYPNGKLASGVPISIIDPGCPNHGGGSCNPTADDLRIDFRGVIARTNNLRGAIGGGMMIFAPTGTSTAFGGDGQTSVMFQINAEYDFRYLVLTANTAIHVGRAKVPINDPVHDNGLGVGDDWSWAVGAFLPFKEGKYRLGLNIFGQTGIQADSSAGGIGQTFFRLENTPVEWNVEGRMKFGGSQHWWAGATLGTLVVPGYGAPDFRAFVAVGAYMPLPGSTATQTDKDRRLALREKWRAEHGEDSDGDGIPDDIDACPDGRRHQGQRRLPEARRP